MTGKVKNFGGRKLANLVIAALEDMKGLSIECINVRRLTPITDYMIIVTGTSSTHIKSLSEEVVRRVKEAKQPVLGVEGKIHAEWVLVDLGPVVVHIMLAPVRALYKLEDLWGFEPAGKPDSDSDSGSAGA